MSRFGVGSRVCTVGIGVVTLMVTAAGLSIGPQAMAAERTIRCHDNARDAQLINRRIAQSEPGDELVFDGPCLVNQTIKLLGDRNYRGTSRTGTIIKEADGANLPAVFASDSYLDNAPTTGAPIELRSMSIDANKAANPRGGDALVIRSWQTVLTDLEINNAHRNGIRLTNRSANGTELRNTQVNGTISNTILNDSGAHGLFVEDVGTAEGTGNSVTDWQLRDNYFAGSGSDAVRMDNAAGWMITGNHLYGVEGDTALSADRLFGTTISNNYIEDFGKFGIDVRLQGDAASTISTNRIFRFNEKGAAGPAVAFLRVTGAYGTPHVAVTGNTIRGKGTGIGLDYEKGDATGLVVTSTGNQVGDVATPRSVGPGVAVDQGTVAATDQARGTY